MKSFQRNSVIGLLSLCAPISAFALFSSPELDLFIGLGSGYQSVKLDQNLSLNADANVSLAGVLLATGTVGGNARPFHQTQTHFAPEIQLGFRTPVSPICAWGMKFSYKYLNLAISDNDIHLPQLGTLTTTLLGVDVYAGDITLQGTQTNINHQFSLIAYTSRALWDNEFYLGLGPVLFGTQVNHYRGTSIVNINAFEVVNTGAPINFSHSQWQWGGELQLGLTRYIDPSLFLDINYSYAISAKRTSHASGIYQSDILGGIVNTGGLYIDASQRITAQGISLTINKLFSM